MIPRPFRSSRRSVLLALAAVLFGCAEPSTGLVVAIEPALPTPSDDLTATVLEAPDPDAEYAYRWYLDGVLEPDLVGDTVESDLTEANQQWRVLVLPTVGSTPGEAAVAEVTISDPSVNPLDQDRDGFETPADCDDEDPTVYPGAEDVCDGVDKDCNAAVPDEEDRDGDGVPACGEDCDDDNEDVYGGNTTVACVPGRPYDSDCSQADPDLKVTWFPDLDEDTDGDASPASWVSLCPGETPPGSTGSDWLSEATASGANDCDDGNAERHSLDADSDGFSTCSAEPDLYTNGASADNDSTSYPNAPEFCDGVDNDLDGDADEDFDVDQDNSFDADEADCVVTYGVFTDCDDSDPGLNGNDADGDGSSSCSGDCDDGNPSISLSDADGDGWFTCPTAANNGLVDCNDSDPALNQDDFDNDAFTSCGGDCDDNNPNVGPQVANQCDGISDTNCDGIFDPLEVDNDSDGATECDGDCDDTTATLGLTDDDGDGATTCDGDCDDSVATGSAVYPGAPALCDGITDNDCNGVADGNEADSDGDGYIICPGGGSLPAGVVGGGDCNDNDPGLTPADNDSDGVSTCGGDCDDSNGALSPNTDNDGDGWSTCPIGAQPADCDDADPALNLSDSDNDGDSSCGGDCDDTDPTLNTNDTDGDGVATCAGDCNDGAGGGAQRPGLTESRDGIDNDCDGLADEGLLSAGDIAIVEMMISGAGQVGDSAAEYVEVINTSTTDIDLRGVVVTIVNVVPDPNNPGSTTTDPLSYTLDADPLGVPLTVLANAADLVVLGRSAAIDGANLTTGNPNATYSIAGTGYSWAAPLLSDLGGTLTLSHGGQTLDTLTWYASGWDAACNGGNGCYDLDQDAGAALDRSRWRPGYSMGLSSFTSAATANNSPSSWCEEQTPQGSGLFGTPAAAQSTSARLCN